MSIVYVVPSPQAERYHRLQSCARRGGKWPALGISQAAAVTNYGLTPCARCAAREAELFGGGEE